MPNKSTYSINQKRLIRRYLIWCYKTTKESLDRVDRYFTQIDADNFFLKELTSQADYKSKDLSQEYKTLVDEFEKYMAVKKENVLKQKYADVSKNILDPKYQYLQNRFKAIEKAIVKFLGKNELTKISELYEQEMTVRILQSREH